MVLGREQAGNVSDTASARINKAIISLSNLSGQVNGFSVGAIGRSLLDNFDDIFDISLEFIKDKGMDSLFSNLAVVPAFLFLLKVGSTGKSLTGYLLQKKNLNNIVEGLVAINNLYNLALFSKEEKSFLGFSLSRRSILKRASHMPGFKRISDKANGLQYDETMVYEKLKILSKIIGASNKGDLLEAAEKLDRIELDINDFSVDIFGLLLAMIKHVEKLRDNIKQYNREINSLKEFKIFLDYVVHLSYGNFSEWKSFKEEYTPALNIIEQVYHSRIKGKVRNYKEFEAVFRLVDDLSKDVISKIKGINSVKGSFSKAFNNNIELFRSNVSQAGQAIGLSESDVGKVVSLAVDYSYLLDYLRSYIALNLEVFDFIKLVYIPLMGCICREYKGYYEELGFVPIRNFRPIRKFFSFKRYAVDKLFTFMPGINKLYKGVFKRTYIRFKEDNYLRKIRSGNIQDLNFYLNSTRFYYCVEDLKKLSTVLDSFTGVVNHTFNLTVVSFKNAKSSNHFREVKEKIKIKDVLKWKTFEPKFIKTVRFMKVI